MILKPDPTANIVRPRASLTFGCHLAAWPHLVEGVKEAGQLGFAGCEAFVDSVLPYDDRVGGVADLAALAGASGVRFAALYADLPLGDFDRREAAIEQAVHAAHLLEMLGGDRLVITPGPAGAPAATVIGALDRIGAEARHHGVAVCVHPHLESAVKDDADLELVLSGTDPRTVLFCADTGHLLAAGCDPAATIRRFAARLGQVHLKDVTADEAHTVCALGTGAVDIEGVFSALDDIAFTGWCIVEVEHVAHSEATAVVRASREHLVRIHRWD